MPVVAPVLVMECPAGHYWPRIDPRWVGGHTRTPQRRVWCPEHQAERRAETQRKINAKKLEVAKAFDAMPLPRTKHCTNKTPNRHAPGAILPIDAFYLRPGKARTDGSQAVRADSQCKLCRREQAEQRRVQQDPVTVRRYQRNYRRNRKRRQRQAQRETHMRRVDASLFFEWAHFVQPTYTSTEGRLIREARANGNMLELRTIDQVMTRYGATDQFAAFYLDKTTKVV